MGKRGVLVRELLRERRWLLGRVNTRAGHSTSSSQQRKGDAAHGGIDSLGSWAAGRLFPPSLAVFCSSEPGLFVCNQRLNWLQRRNRSNARWRRRWCTFEVRTRRRLSGDWRYTRRLNCRAALQHNGEWPQAGRPANGAPFVVTRQRQLSPANARPLATPHFYRRCAKTPADYSHMTPSACATQFGTPTGRICGRRNQVWTSR